MPNRDRTGPEGRGPMTGRGQGFCIDFEIPDFESFFDRESDRGFRREFEQGFGRGLGRGQMRGEGRGFRFRIQPRQFTKEEQIELLKKQKKAFEVQAEAIGKQLKEFDKPLKKQKPLRKQKPLEKKKRR